MNKVWINSLSEEQQAVVKEAASMGRPALERLMTILKDYEASSVVSMTRDEWFSGNWNEKQAALIGEVKAYRKVHDLISSLLTKR
jgi:hypothetical protein